MNRSRFFLAALLLALLACPPQWYPMPVRLQLTSWFGADAFRALPESVQKAGVKQELFCPEGAS